MQAGENPDGDEKRLSAPAAAKTSPRIFEVAQPASRHGEEQPPPTHVDPGLYRPAAPERAPEPAPGPNAAPEVDHDPEPTPERTRERAMTHSGQPVRPERLANQTSSFQRALGAVRMVLPVVQKVLPLLDGNVASVVSNLLTSHPQGPAVDLVPLESAMGKMRTEHLDLQSRVAEQNTMLKRVGQQLETVSEAADRNTLQQREMMEDLHSLRKRVIVFAWVGLGLLAISILVNALLFMRVEGVLH